MSWSGSWGKCTQLLREKIVYLKVLISRRANSHDLEGSRICPGYGPVGPILTIPGS